MADRPGRRLRVTQLLADPNRSAHPVENPYTSLLVSSLPDERIETRYFGWADVLTSDADVVHMHWPENSLRHPRTAVRLLKRALFLLFILRLRMGRIAVVRTVHNARPHEEGDRGERWILGLLEARTTLWVTLNDVTPTPDPRRTVVIPHGHYRDRFASPTPEPRRGNLVHFGMLKPYKGVDELISAFAAVPHELDYRLHIVGESHDGPLTERVRAASRRDERMDIDLRFVDETELADAVGAAEIVVLPYRAIENSGSALLALSLHRPVILPESPSTRLLEEEFGDEWVGLYRGPLTAETLQRAVEDLRDRPRDAAGPDMSERDWPRLGSLLADAYDRAAASLRRRA